MARSQLRFQFDVTLKRRDLSRALVVTRFQRQLPDALSIKETLMLIVPTDEPLLVNVRVDPIDIDKVHIGQDVVIRLPGLNPRTTPELFASVTRVAPDATVDTATGQQYYAARISLSESELARLPEGVELVPGMPVEAYVQIGDRTVLSYLIDPFVQQLRRAMREE